MGVRFTFGTLPLLVPGENIRFTKRCIWFVSCKSLPTYRISLSLPPLMQLGVYVTDQRILLLAKFLCLFKQQFSLWYKPHGDGDVLQAIRVPESTFTYVEVNSEAPVKSWMRSAQCRICLYMHNALEFQRAVNAMVGEQPSTHA